MSVDPAVNTAAGAPLAHIFAGRRDGERSVQSREPVRGNSPAVGEGAVGGVAYGEHSFWSAISRRNGGGREVFECDLSSLRWDFSGVQPDLSRENSLCRAVLLSEDGHAGRSRKEELEEEKPLQGYYSRHFTLLFG